MWAIKRKQCLGLCFAGAPDSVARWQACYQTLSSFAAASVCVDWIDRRAMNSTPSRVCGLPSGTFQIRRRRVLRGLEKVSSGLVGAV